MKRTSWFIRKRNADYARLADTLGISPVCVRVMRNRGAETPEDMRRFLYGTTQDLADPALLKNAQAAASLLRSQITQGSKIRIIGDYDVDGVCATAILLRVLTDLGADVDYDIPDRVVDGYGMNMRLVKDAVTDGVQTIITCDNGISAAKEIAWAKEQGLRVIVTDHHLPPVDESDPDEIALPPADVIVDPAVPGETYPHPGMCGAVTAWHVMRLLTGKTLEELLPLAAMATVCDVMDISGENRIIVLEGLARMRSITDGGLCALVRECGLEPETLDAYDLGFRIGPCLNAAGRLDTASICIDLLMSRSAADARKLAGQLVSLNEQRKQMTQEGTLQALRQIEDMPPALAKIPVVYLPSCHESVAGIIAGRIREAKAHPAIVLTDSSREGVLKGSGRSIEGWHMFRGLQSCAHLLIKFGGHPMAAGLSLQKEDLEAFCRELNAGCTLQEEDFCEKKMIDMELSFSQLSLSLAQDLKRLEPFGKGNEKPLFVTRDVTLTYARVMGARRNVLRCMAVDGSGERYPAVWFGDADALLADLRGQFSADAVQNLLDGRQGLKVHLLYYPRINEYNGVRSLQLQIEDYKCTG